MTKPLEGVSIIIPTYNEKNNLPFLFYMIKKYLAPLGVKYEIVLIDDNSPDGTYGVAEKLRDVLKLDMKLIKRPSKLGLGSSYVEGIKNSKYDFVLIMDADLSHHPKYIPEMIRKQRKSNCDVVSGTRYRRGGGASNWPTRRVFISKTLNYVCRVLFNPKFTDLTGSYRLYRKDLLNKVLNQIQNKGFLFQVEIALRSEKHLKAKVDEVPIVFIERIYGTSKLNLSEMKSGVVGLLKLMWQF